MAGRELAGTPTGQEEAPSAAMMRKTSPPRSTMYISPWASRPKEVMSLMAKPGGSSSAVRSVKSVSAPPATTKLQIWSLQKSAKK